MMVWLMPATISFLLVSLVLFISILSASWMNFVQLISGSVFMTCLISPVGHCLVIMYLIFISHLAQWVGVLVVCLIRFVKCYCFFDSSYYVGYLSIKVIVAISAISSLLFFQVGTETH